MNHEPSKTSPSGFLHEDAVRHVRHTVYSLNNTILTQDQKIEVESWYQSSFVVSNASLVVTCWLWQAGKINGWEAFLYASLCGVAIVVLFRVLYIKTLSFLIGMTLGFPFVSAALYIAFAMFLFVQGGRVPGVVLGINTVLGGIPSGILGMVAVTILHGSKDLHPKYAFAKKHLGVKM